MDLRSSPAYLSRTVRGYLVAAGMVILFTVLKSVLRVVIDLESPFLVFLGAVVISAWYGGLWPGLFATILSVISIDLLFVNPGSFWNGPPSLTFRLFLFLLEGIVISYLNEILHASKRSAEASMQKAQEEVMQREVEAAERKRAEEALRIAQARLQAAVRAGAVGTWLWDIPANKIIADTFMAQLYGLDPAEALEGLPFQMFQNAIHDDERQQAKELISRVIATGGEYEDEYRVRGSDGKYRWVVARGRVDLDEKNKAGRFSGAVFDVTALKQAQEELRKANRMKDDFLAIVSHELRTPLAAVMSWVRLVRSGRLNAEKMSKGLEAMERNVKLQSQLIEDMLDISRVTSGKLQLDKRPLEPVPILNSVLNVLSRSAEAKKIRLQVTIQPDLGILLGDAKRLEQVVFNLLANAIKFTGENGSIMVDVTRTDTHLEISVKDTGVGIAPDFLPHIFDAFRQADPSSTRKFGGLGLGLTLVRQIVELHEGTVRAESPGEGMGSMFVVRLPSLPRSEAHTDSESGGQDVWTPNEALKGLRILVIDNEPDICDVLALVLQQCAAETKTATSALEALKVFDEWNPDLLLCDIAMPDIDGYELIRRIRDQDGARGRNVLAVALSAYSKQSEQDEAEGYGFQKTLTKPVEPARLVSTLTQLAANKKREAIQQEK